MIQNSAAKTCNKYILIWRAVVCFVTFIYIVFTLVHIKAMTASFHIISNSWWMMNYSLFIYHPLLRRYLSQLQPRGLHSWSFATKPLSFTFRPCVLHVTALSSSFISSLKFRVLVYENKLWCSPVCRLLKTPTAPFPSAPHTPIFATTREKKFYQFQWNSCLEIFLKHYAKIRMGVTEAKLDTFLITAVHRRELSTRQLYSRRNKPGTHLNGSHAGLRFSAKKVAERKIWYEDRHAGFRVHVDQEFVQPPLIERNMVSNLAVVFKDSI
jgi:hypothetical protein